MAEDEKAAKKEGPARSSWAGLLEAAAKQFIGVLVTAGGLIGFVAFSGAVIVWSRFFAAEVPADQAVNVVPQEELVAIGSSLLLIFGFFGALAVIAIFLIDRGGRVTPGMSRGLLLLLTIEGVVAIALVEAAQWQRTVVALEAFLLAVGVILWSTFSGRFTELDRTSLPDLEKDERDAEQLEDHVFRSSDDKDPICWRTYRGALVKSVGAAVGVAGIALVAGRSNLEAWMAGLAVLGLALGLALILWTVAFHRDPKRKTDAAKAKALKAKARRVRARENALLSGEVRASLDLKPREEKPRKPPRFMLAQPGIALVATMLALAVLGPSLALEKWWVVASMGSAILLGAGLWRIASLAEAKFTWYGLAIFISVPLFGTLTSMARNIEDPQVQPMALIRNTDGPDEAIQGIYVTEADERIYFATMATEGCTNGLSPHSGRLLWVPKSEVVAMTVGPSQDVDDAAKAALEMSYALTPGLGIANGSEMGLAAAEGGGESESPELDKRLEGVGAAVHPNFGSGLSLVPPDASPGDVVTLRMSVPNREGALDGFGKERNGKTLRVGGIPAAIIRERVDSASDAEFVKTTDGKVLTLDKEGVYGRGKAGRFYLVENPRSFYGRRFVKLSNGSGAKVEGEGDAPSGAYLALQNRGYEAASGRVALLEGQEVTLESGEKVELESYLLRQGWHEDHVRFRVPDNAASGVVSVECRQLAGEPVLDVARPPTARIAVRMQAGSENVSFDSSGSRGEGRIVSRQWKVEGHPDGGGTTVSLDLSPRLKPYTVRLVVTDENHRSDSAQLQLARLPASLFRFDQEKPENGLEIRRVGEALARAVGVEPPTAIELDGNADDVGPSSYNMGLSMRRAERVRRELLPEGSSSAGAAIPVPVILRAFGESCPLDQHPGRSQVNRRVELFMLGQGAAVAPRPGCHAGREEKSSWQLPLPVP